MWKRLMQKTSNIFLEDIIIEEEVKVKRTVNQRDTGDKDIKMTYKYPNSTTFRFPVISDYYVDETKQEKTINPEQNRKRTTQSNRTYLTPRKDNPLAAGYEKQKSLKELEDIPAYMRRRKQVQIDMPEKEEQTTSIERIPLVYTNPDELDRVFKKKDAVKEPEPVVKPHVTERTNTVDRDIPAYQRRKVVKANHLQDERAEKAVEPSKIEEQPLVSAEHPKTHKEHAETRYEPAKIEQADNTEIDIEEIVPGYLLDDPETDNVDDSIWLEEQKMLLEQTLSHFNIDAQVVKVTQGPSVTRLEIQPALGVRVSKIRNLSDDIKLNMAAQDIRIEAPIPGKNTIGIEIPNAYPQVVGLQEIIETDSFATSKSPLTIALGLTIEGDPLITNIEKMPHGLIAGATGSGKSVCINSILLSLLYKTSHEDLKLLLIDPKMVELAPYNGIPHLISPVLTDAKAATMALKWAVGEMEDRYNRLAEARVRNIKAYNNKMVNENQPAEKMPYIVIVIDELADLMIVSPQEVEDSICRIAQKARACGIHLLVATQRPSVDVITGLIKANIPTRIAFSVSSQVDSRTIIDAGGAEKLLGKGDMLFVENGSNKSLRLQGPFVSDEEIDRVTNHFRAVAKPSYLFEQEQLLLEIPDEDKDELFNEVVLFVLEQNQASTSLLQRHFRIGYNRAARLIDTLEEKGIVSGLHGSKPRDILITKSQIDELLAN